MTSIEKATTKTVLVTGGGSGMGAAVAKLFADQGAHVFVGDVNIAGADATAQVIREHNGSATAVQLDVASEEQVQNAFNIVEQSGGGLDALVNCAGLSVDGASETYSLRGWQQCLDVNLTGTFLCCRAAGQLMIPRRTGAIVNFGSTAGVSGVPRMAAYTAAKHGVVGLTKALAVEWGKFGVRVNCVCPGATQTAMLAGLSETFRKERIRRIPLNRFGQAVEQAAVAVFLASEDAAYVNGAIVCVDGGVAAMAPGTSESILAGGAM